MGFGDLHKKKQTPQKKTANGSIGKNLIHLTQTKSWKTKENDSKTIPQVKEKNLKSHKTKSINENMQIRSPPHTNISQKQEKTDRSSPKKQTNQLGIWTLQMLA